MKHERSRVRASPISAPFRLEKDFRPRPDRPTSLSLGHGPRKRHPAALRPSDTSFALRHSLSASPRCFEPISTTDVHVTSTRSKNIIFGDCRRAPAENRLRSPLRSSSPHNVSAALRGRRRTTLRSSSLRRLVLDGTVPASGRSRPRHILRDAEERGSFFDCVTLRRSNPLTLLEATHKESAQTLRLCSAEHGSKWAHVNATTSNVSSKCLPSEKSKTSPLAGARPRDPHPLADEWRIRTSSSMFEDFD